MDYPLISPEKPDEFVGVSTQLIVLIRQSRIEKAEIHRFERQRIALLLEPDSAAKDHLVEELDRRISDMESQRAEILHSIARMTPGYSEAVRMAVEKHGYDVAAGSVRFYKRRGCYTFWTPGGVVAIKAEG